MKHEAAILLEIEEGIAEETRGSLLPTNTSQRDIRMIKSKLLSRRYVASVIEIMATLNFSFTKSEGILKERWMD